MITIFISLLFLILLLFIIFKNKNEYFAGSNVSIYSLPNLLPLTYPPYEYHCVFGVPPYNNWCKYG
jgi:hypothetical protein